MEALTHSILTKDAQTFEVTDADLRRAWRECKLVDRDYEDAMKNRALAIAIRHIAQCNVRRHHALMELQRRDRKRAQANDSFD